MNSIQSQKIGLCIAGTKSRQGGFTPLVIVGILAGGEANGMDRVTLVVEKPVYVIKHTPEYILYLLIDRKVKPCDRDTPAVLSIALTIARDMRLADGKSPYALLKEVYDKFRSDYMEPVGNDDRFINKDVNPMDFISIVERYPLEKRLFDEYVAMDSSGLAGTLCVPQEKMEDLFRDSQYPEFANFKEIEIGNSCQTTMGLENIEIPRPVVYSIELNGKLIEAEVSRPDDKFDTRSVLHDTADVEYEHMSFSLGELLNAPEHRLESGKSSVVLDKERNRIVCAIDENSLNYSLEYKIIGGTETEQDQLVDWISAGKVKLTFDGSSAVFSSSPLSNPKQTFIPVSWAHRRVSYLTMDLKITAFKLSVESIVNDEEKHVKVTITITPYTTVGSESTYLLEYEIQGGKKEQREQLVGWITDGTLKLTFGNNSADFSSNPNQASIPASWVAKNVGYQIQNQELTFGLDLGLKFIDKAKKHVKVVIKISKNRDTFPAPITGVNSNDNQETNQDDPQPEKTKKIKILLGVCFLLGMCLGAGIVGGFWHHWGSKKLTYKDYIQIAKEILPKKPSIITKEMLEPHTLLRRHIDNLLVEDYVEDNVENSTANNPDDRIDTCEVTTQSTGEATVEVTDHEAGRNEAIKELLHLINEKNIVQCRNSEGWKYLSQKQRIAVEAVCLNFKGYDKLSTAAKKKVEKLTEKEIYSIEEVEAIQDLIVKIQNNDKK